jgi:hypothetical protein
VLASYWYSKTYNKYITDPNTQFLLGLEVYVDKTAKNAGLTSYAGEPFLLSVLHLKKSLREHLSAWFVQAYLPDLESGSSAKKKQYSHRYLTRGMSNHNYHKIMDAVLEGIVAAQKKGGFKAFIQMGDVVHLMMVIPVLTFVKGNAKSGDTLVSCFGGKNCTALVPRMCLCGKADLDNPLHRCLWIQMAYQKAVNEKVMQLSLPPETCQGDQPELRHQRREQEKEMKEYMAALDAMSAHSCDNAFFDIKFGHNPFGITLATPSDKMHLFESGIVKRVCQMFVDSMSTDIRVQVDNLMETLFRSQRMTLSNSQNFLHTNFGGGAMHLMMLSSHHWPGMMFAFLLLLLTPMGAETCSSCFLNKDVEEPDYDWDSAPGLDLENVYKPPMLCQDADDSIDIHHTSTGNDDHKLQEPEEVPADDSSSSSSEASTKRRIPNKNNGPVTMNCSNPQFMNLLKKLLMFHAMYKCGPPLFRLGSSPSDADHLLLLLRKLVVQIITYCPRQEGNK